MGDDILGDSLTKFGISVSLSDDGNTVVVGAHLADVSFTNGGQATVYKYDGTNWVQHGSPIIGEKGNDKNGISVSIF